jgi:hypothetical protein
MTTTREGPPLEPLLRRLAETPPDFLAEPRIGKQGRVHVPAVVGDLCDRLGRPVAAEALAPFAGADARKDRNRLGIALLHAWLLAAPELAASAREAEGLPALLAEAARELAPHTPAPRFVEDPERREELVRHTLARLGLHPAGETATQAQDRLQSLSAAERARVLAASRAAEARAREIRAALARKAAEESADKWTRE